MQHNFRFTSVWLDSNFIAEVSWRTCCIFYWTVITTIFHGVAVESGRQWRKERKQVSFYNRCLKGHPRIALPRVQEKEPMFHSGKILKLLGRQNCLHNPLSSWWSHTGTRLKASHVWNAIFWATICISFANGRFRLFAVIFHQQDTTLVLFDGFPILLPARSIQY